MAIEVASLVASLEADITPLDANLAAAAAKLQGGAETAAVATDAVAGVGAASATAAEGLGATAAMSTTVSEESLTAAAALSVETENFDLLGAAAGAADTAMSLAMGPLIALGVALAALKFGLDNTLTSADQLGQQVHQLGLDFGFSADESSKLIYVANVTGVSVDSLTRALDAAVRGMKTNRTDGIEPNIDGLAMLADKWNAIPDPIQRAAFEMQAFGRSGQDINAVMALGGDGIRALGEQATTTGAVLSTQSAGSLHDYDLALNKLKEDAQGSGVRVGVDLAGALTGAVKGADDGVLAWDALVTALKDGLITTDEYRSKLFGLETGMISSKTILDQLSPAIQRVNADMANGSDASDRAAAAQQYVSDKVAAQAGSYSDAASIIASYTGNVNLQAESQWKAQQATDAYNAALQEQAGAAELQAGMAGAVTKAEANYSQVVETNTPKLAKLRAELAQYTAAQGTSIEIASAGKYTQEQYAVAQDRLRIAEERLAETHTKTAAAHDALVLAVRTAQDTVDKMGGSLITTATGTADYSSKIADLKAQIDPLVQAEDDAKAAIDKTTAALLYQAVSANLPVEAQTSIAHSLGLVSDADYDLAVKAEALKRQYLDGKITLDQLDSSLAALKYNSENASAAVTPLAGHVAEAGLQADIAAGKAQNLADAIANIHDKQVTLTVFMKTPSTLFNGVITNSSTYAQGVNDFVVPAGFPDDSYPIMVSSGEHVSVSQPGSRPAGGGGGGGGTTNVYINDRLATALYLERQRLDRITALERNM